MIELTPPSLILSGTCSMENEHLMSSHLQDDSGAVREDANRPSTSSMDMERLYTSAADEVDRCSRSSPDRPVEQPLYLLSTDPDVIEPLNSTDHHIDESDELVDKAEEDETSTPQQQNVPRQIPRPFVQLYHTGYVSNLALCYAALMLFAWVVTCIQSFRPVATNLKQYSPYSSR